MTIEPQAIEPQGIDSQASDSPASDSPASDSRASDSRASDSRGSDSRAIDPQGSEPPAVVQPGGNGSAAVAGAVPAAESTTLPVRPLAGAPTRRDLRVFRRDDWLNLCGALASGVSVALLLFGRIAPLSGVLGLIVVAYLAFLAAYALLVRLGGDGPQVRDRIWTVVLYSAAGTLMSGLFLVVGFTVVRGASALHHPNFFTQDLSDAGPLDPLTVGGIEHALVGTLEMITIALVITVPLGLTCAVYLTQVGGFGSRFVRTVVEAMTALPSIVAGLFIYATWILILHFELSGLAAALALSVMMLPIIIRAADVVLRLVPGNLREAAEALGAPRWRTVWHVVLPTARSGLATSVILGTARGIGETSPVLLTAGYTTFMNTDPLHGPQVSLPLATFELVKSPQPTMIARGFATAAFLMSLVVVLFVLARAVGGRAPGQPSSRQVVRNAQRSARDVIRFSRRPAPIALTASRVNSHSADDTSGETREF
ncbi:phosphate ABC transporter permease PstA [Rugosimonospora africana]|uniref:Phosphate transport system permease protein PstA n=1 Tax=Rugosimonospora africana TaxID=556532 RepID=A0A8J3QZV0_9ACTN|nr:phosphate ABC transporter permease PstA [Rugosimonospora africana]GIH20385.1 phosphate transport system permease protein PstA [Rugosimonospora africana]